MCHVAGHEKSLAPFEMNGFQKHFHLPDEQPKRDHHRRAATSFQLSKINFDFRCVKQTLLPSCQFIHKFR